MCAVVLVSHGPAGFKNIDSWLSDVREHADPNLTCILVGNKIDLCESGSRPREVTTEEGEAWAREHDLLFVEASAKSGCVMIFRFERAAALIQPLDSIFYLLCILTQAERG